MSCYHPLNGFICQDGRFRMRELPGSRVQSVPCGQCVGCRLDRSRSWAIRCMHEASLYSRNCFITLTYSPEHYPRGGSLDYSHFQNFMKRLRFKFCGSDTVVTPTGESSRPIRFYMAGEYGDKLWRPHFHACLFNFDFDDKRRWSKSNTGSVLYRSQALEELWPYGFSSIGDVNFRSAAYVARYIMKKVTGNAASSHYNFVDPDTGEVHELVPEFNKMSLKPGIGARWFEKFPSDVYKVAADGETVVQDFVIVNGKPVKPPRFYDKLYARDDKRFLEFLDGTVKEYSPRFEPIRLAREERALSQVEDNSPERLTVKEKIAISRVHMLKRVL